MPKLLKQLKQKKQTVFPRWNFIVAISCKLKKVIAAINIRNCC